MLISLNVQSQDIERSVDVESFTQLSLSTSADVYLTQGDEQEIRYEGSQKFFDDMEFEVKGETLKIKMKDKNWWNNNKNWKEKSPRIYITVASLEKVSVAGSGGIVGKNTFHAEDFDVTVAGSGEVDMDVVADDVDIIVAGSGETNLDVNADDVSVSISGSGEVDLVGTTDDLSITISGSGECHADELMGDDVNVRISGSGEADVYAKDTLNVSISGSGDVTYSGNATVHKSISGSGDVNKH